MKTGQISAKGVKKDGDQAMRNVWCPKYEECLTNAALLDLSMGCEGCPMRMSKIPVFILTLAEIEGCKALLDAVFRFSRNRY